MRAKDFVSVDAPAKINLGLEILGKRDDGFHELRTIMASIDLADTLHVFVDDSGHGEDLPGLAFRKNLISRALEAFRKAVPNSLRLGWSLEKRIPVAAGLGGASADAAAALLAANSIAGSPLDQQALHLIAASLGSDVPFFLGSPVALSSGRGIELEPLPSIDLDLLLVIPGVVIQQKTSSLYSMVCPADFSDGKRTDCNRYLLATSRIPNADQLSNAFQRPLAEIAPQTWVLRDALAVSGYASYGLSGAGPSHYVVLDGDDPSVLLRLLRKQFGTWLTLIPARTRTTRMYLLKAERSGA